ncbi:hypothetical protein [Streptomyces litchfieldiae]|uniref:Uncharacterized protein n=1 Tax=Streptomyces litchfieldiae TaxID=3075543 RepID=A0ABU2MIP0_9ACTN|nr:hypothetical protein [Streptomyces sp. DSM 44938]MDT0341466.1 hypothetical protein [Streptomyces sp. DSM 44938]
MTSRPNSDRTTQSTPPEAGSPVAHDAADQPNEQTEAPMPFLTLVSDDGAGVCGLDGECH